MNTAIIPSLDGFRAAAVFLVLLAHAGWGSLIPGGFGVTVFFFLSGYLITTLLVSEYEKYKGISFINFFIRRLLRLLPPLLLTLVIGYVLVGVGVLDGGISWLGALSQTFYLANYHIIFDWPGDVPDGTGILWSLAVEEHFYLLFPAIFYFLISNHSKKSTAIILSILCLLLLTWRSVLIFYFQAGADRIQYASDTRIDSILFGCIMAIIWNPVNQKASAKMQWHEYLMLGGSLGVILFTFFYRNEQFRETFRYTIQGLALAPIFFLAIKHHENWLFKILNVSWVKKLGVYSYFVYLSHFMVINVLRDNGIITSTPLLIIATAAICVLYSFLIDRYFDSYFRELRKSFRHGNTRFSFWPKQTNKASTT